MPFALYEDISAIFNLFSIRKNLQDCEPIDGTNKMSLKEKARLNVCIAKDLAENFGGKKVDYLKMLNQKLRERITFNSSVDDRPYYAKAA